MKRIFVPTKSGSDWQRLLAKPVLHWKKGASAMTAAAAWETTPDRLPLELSRLLESSKDDALNGLKLLAALPEWEVPLEGGDTTSHTDVLALATNARGLCVIAVEAKVDEDFGPLIEAKRKNASSGQLARLAYLQELLAVGAFDDSIRYQLLHRTASALLTAREFHAGTAMMIVQSFGAKPTLRADFEAFCKAMGAQRLSDGIFVVPSFKAPRLFLGWCAGDQQFRHVDLPGSL